MFSRFRKKYQKEDGAYMVITALLLVAVIGMMALAVDQGSWLSQKRTEQNAVDAAAVAAAQIYANDGSADQAVDAAVTAANGNGIVVTASDLVITPDNAVNPKKVKAVLTLDADNYFYNNGTAKNKTSVVVSSEAEIYETQTSGGGSIINPAIEADDFHWNGQSTKANEITGDIVIGSSGFLMNTPTSLNGNLSSDGNVGIYTSYFPITGTINSKKDITITNPLTVDGNLESCGNITYNGNPGNTVIGDVHANGNIDIKNSTVGGNMLAKGALTFTNGILNGKVHSNGNTFLQNATIKDGVQVTGSLNCDNSTIGDDAITEGDAKLQRAAINGSILAKGKVEINDGTTIKNNVISETWTQINGGGSKIDGTFYVNESGAQYDWQRIQKWQKDQMKKTDGSPIDFEPYSGQTVPAVGTVGTVTHTDWVWKWDCLANTPSTAHKVVTGDLVGFANSIQGEEASAALGNTQMCDRVSLHMTGNINDKTPVTSIVFYNGYTFQKFVEYLRASRGVPKTQPLYFPGSVRVQNASPAGDPDAFIVADGNIEWWAPCNFTGSTGTSFLSINGNIDIQGAGNKNINGAVITLNPNAQIKLDAGNNYTSETATVKGGVISHGKIQMTGVWSIIADQNWQKYVPISGGTKTIKKVKLVS